MKIKTIIISLVLVCTLCALSFASTPDYTYTNSVQTNISVGTNEVGVIDFVRQPYLSTNYTLSNISAQSYERYDQIQWTGNFSLQVTIPSGTNVFLLPNDKMTLSQVGNYLITQPSNTSNTAIITVSTETNAVINIVSSVTPLTLTFPSTITLNAGDVPLSLVVAASSGLSAGNYPVQFNFTSNFRNYTLDITFVLAQDTKWKVSADTVQNTINAQSNSFQSIGYIKIDSLANVDVTLTSTTTGNASLFLVLQPSQTLFRGGQTYFNVQLQVPNNQPDGYFTSTINITNGVYSYAKNIAITIRDTTPPTIDNLTFTSESMGVDTTAQVIAKDNIGVSYVTIDGNGEVTNMTKDQQLFTKHYTFTGKNVNTFVVCAYDSSSNKFCQTYTKQFSQMNLIIANVSINLPSRKVGGFASRNIFLINSTTAQNVTVQLKDFFHDMVYNGTPLDRFSVQLQDITGRVYTFATINQTIQLTTSGAITLQVKGNNYSNYGLTLIINVPSYAKTVDPMTIRGKFQDYDSPKAFTTLVSGRNMSCVPTDTGEIESSYQTCTYTTSILDDLENAPIVTTLRAQKSEESKNQLILDDAQTRVLVRNILISFSFAIALTAFGYMWYRIKVYPRARFTK